MVRGSIWGERTGQSKNGTESRREIITLYIITLYSVNGIDI